LSALEYVKKETQFFKLVNMLKFVDLAGIVHKINDINTRIEE